MLFSQSSHFNVFDFGDVTARDLCFIVHFYESFYDVDILFGKHITSNDFGIPGM